jgi:hypothetical protein
VVVPAATPLITPDASTVPMPVAVLLHMPLPAASLSGVVASSHTVAVPVMVPATGSGLTVATVVAAAVPQLLVTV